MTAEALRRAAALMRKRTINAGISPWSAEGKRVVNREVYAKCGDERTAHHIASWHPAVALAVADWLDDHAETAELFVAKEIPASAWSMNWQTSHNCALAVARAYLDGERP